MGSQEKKELIYNFILVLVIAVCVAVVVTFNVTYNKYVAEGLIIGGDDINPNEYGENNDLGLSKEIHPVADKVDKAIINHAIKYTKPMFGICRGIQAICAFMGGKLVQDLKYENVNHPLTEEHKHYVDKVNNIGVAKLLPDHFLINSWHHQAVKVVPEGFEVIFKNDETIEAMEHTTLPILGVQWHPECMTEDDFHFSIIKTFINKTKK